MSTRNRISVPPFASILDPKMKLQARQSYKYSFLLQTSCLANWHLSAKEQYSTWLSLNSPCVETTCTTQT